MSGLWRILLRLLGLGGEPQSAAPTLATFEVETIPDDEKRERDRELARLQMRAESVREGARTRRGG